VGCPNTKSLESSILMKKVVEKRCVNCIAGSQISWLRPCVWWARP